MKRRSFSGAPRPRTPGIRPTSRTPLPADARALLPALRAWIIGLALYRRVRPHDAEDVAHDAIVRALRGPFVHEPGRTLSHALRCWLIGIVAHVAVELHRRERARPGVHPFCDALNSPEAEHLVAPDVAAAVMARSTLRELARSTSPARWRAILLHAEGAPGGEIAEGERAKLATIYNRIREGRSELAAALARENARVRRCTRIQKGRNQKGRSELAAALACERVRPRRTRSKP